MSKVTLPVALSGLTTVVGFLSITLVRIGVVPLLLFMPLMLGQAASQVMGWVFVVAVLTDLLDGWIARSWKMVTRFGVKP